MLVQLPLQLDELIPIVLHGGTAGRGLVLRGRVTAAIHIHLMRRRWDCWFACWLKAPKLPCIASASYRTATVVQLVAVLQGRGDGAVDSHAKR